MACVLEANLVFMVNSLCWKCLFIFRFDVCTYSPALEHSLQNVWSKFGIYGKLFWWSCLLFIFRFDIRTGSLALEYFLKTSIAETGVGWEYGRVCTETFCFWTLYDQKEFTCFVSSKRSRFQFFNLIGHKQWLVCLMCLMGTWEDRDSQWVKCGPRKFS